MKRKLVICRHFLYNLTQTMNKIVLKKNLLCIVVVVVIVAGKTVCFIPDNTCKNLRKCVS